jgi:hypothetical protein
MLRGVGACPCNGVGNVVTDTWNGMSTTQKVLAGAGVGLVAVIGVSMMTGGKKRRR